MEFMLSPKNDFTEQWMDRASIGPFWLVSTAIANTFGARATDGAHLSTPTLDIQIDYPMNCMARALASATLDLIRAP